MVEGRALARRAGLVSPSGAAYAGLAVCVAMWGMVFVAVARLLPHIDAVQIVSLRFAIVAVVCVAVLAAFPAVRPAAGGHDRLHILGCGALAVPGAQYVIVEAQNFLSPTLTALIVTFSPAVAAVLAAVFLGARLGRLEVSGFVIALVGVALVLVVGTGSGSSASHSSAVGAAIAVISPIAWAGYTLLVSPLANRHPPVGVVCCVLIVGALWITPTYPHAVAGIGALDAAGWFWLLVLGLGGTVLPNLLWVVSLRSLPVHRTTAFMYLIPLFATLWAAVVLGRAPDLIAIPGGALVLLGVFLTQGWRGRRSPVAAAGEATAGPAA